MKSKPFNSHLFYVPLRTLETWSPAIPNHIFLQNFHYYFLFFTSLMPSGAKWGSFQSILNTFTCFLEWWFIGLGLRFILLCGLGGMLVAMRDRGWCLTTVGVVQLTFFRASASGYCDVALHVDKMAENPWYSKGIFKYRIFPVQQLTWLDFIMSILLYNCYCICNTLEGCWPGEVVLNNVCIKLVILVGSYCLYQVDV